MNFISQLSLRLFFWTIIFGFVSGIFGISIALITISDFYLQEGTQQESTTYTFKVLPSSKKILTDIVLSELQNIEGIAFVDPYFSPTNKSVASINYFGFSASYPIQIEGIPKRLGQKKANPNYKNEWDSTDLNILPILLPKQAITLYNNLAPQRSWPTLQENSFLGIPGVQLTIEFNSQNKNSIDLLSQESLSNTSINTISNNISTNEIISNNSEQNTNNTLQFHPLKIIISGFDQEGFGTTVQTSAQKFYAIFDFLGLNPVYNYIIVETLPGLTKAQTRQASRTIQDLGFNIASAKEESFQQGLFIRIKYTITIFGFSILIAFIILLYYSIRILLTTIKQRILLYRLWAIPEYTFIKALVLTIIFAVITGFISWVVCFFAVVPAQDYIIDTIKQFGINTPSLRTSVQISLQTAIISTSLYFTIIVGTLIIFYIKVPQANHIKKF